MPAAPAAASPTQSAIPDRARSARLQALLERLRQLPLPVQPLALAGARRLLDYQDAAYAGQYLARLKAVVDLDERHGAGDWALAQAVARGLALWMSFEDTIRVADLKTRKARFERVRAEVRADPGQILGITEFMGPRAQEIAGTLPAALGRWVLSSAPLARWLTGFVGARQVRTSTVSGFLLLYVLAGLRRWRRRTLRFRQEDERIVAWLGRIEQLAAANHGLAVELARAQRLVKGYGETHERGLARLGTLVAQVNALAARPDGAAILARLQEAALADEEGTALARELAACSASPAGCA